MKNIIYFILLFALFFISCEEFLEENPKTVLSSTSLLNDLEGASKVIQGTYYALKDGDNGSGLGHRALITQTIVHSDMIQARASFSSNSEWNKPLNSVNIDRTFPAWVNLYECINISNTVIEALERLEINANEENIRKELIAEARFMRALSYYYLVRLYGDVPLRVNVISNPEEAEKGAARSSVSEVYSSVIIPDLEYATENAKNSWDESNSGRVTSWAAKLLLAEVHLVNENWDLAKDLANDVISNGGFNLVLIQNANDYQKIYGSNVITHDEDVFSYKYSNVIDGIGNWEAQLASGFNGGQYTVGNSGWFGYTANMTNPLVTDWNDDDKRKEWSIYNQIIIGDDTTKVDYNFRGAKHWGVRKWRDNKAPHWRAHGNDIPVLRLSDALLIYAEAAAMANGGEPTDLAVERLNMVRRRAYGFDPNTPVEIDYPAPGNYNGSFQDSVLVERAYEFFAEGKRWYDLLRTGKAKQQIELAFPGVIFNDSRLKWPLPPEEIQNNSALSEGDQNQGY